MKEKKFKLKAQSTMEFTLIFACLVASCLVMKGYVQRSVQGGLRQASDQIGGQYSADNADISITTTFRSDSNINSKIIQAYHPKTKMLLEDKYGQPIHAMRSETVAPVKETTKRKGYEKMGKFKNKLF